MKVKVFIDGSSGTTGLRIADRLAARPEIELLSISAEGRKDVHERAKVINSADLAFLCLLTVTMKMYASSQEDRDTRHIMIVTSLLICLRCIMKLVAELPQYVPHQAYLES